MPNTQSAIEALPADAQAQIITWLETEPRSKVLARIAEPPPVGFGLKTHRTTLNRFYARHLARERQADAELAKLLAPGATGDPTEAAAKAFVSQFAFEIATKPRRNVQAFKALSYWLLRGREAEQRERQVRLLEQRVAFEREKWEYDIARQTLTHHQALYEIRVEPEITLEERINRARSLLFGRPIEELPK